MKPVLQLRPSAPEWEEDLLLKTISTTILVVGGMLTSVLRKGSIVMCFEGLVYPKHLQPSQDLCSNLP